MKTLLKVIVGSKLHRLDNENSDVDYRGIFQVPLIDHISPFIKLKTTDWIEGDKDSTLFELTYFMKAAVNGNPTMLEILWSDMIVEASKIGYKLVENRNLFLSKNSVYYAHQGYAHNQLNKMDLLNPTPRTPKAIIAYIRSMRQGAELLTGNFNPVYEYEDRDFILKIKNEFNGSMIPECARLMSEVTKELNNAYSLSELPPLNYDKLNHIILYAYS